MSGHTDADGHFRYHAEDGNARGDEVRRQIESSAIAPWNQEKLEQFIRNKNESCSWDLQRLPEAIKEVFPDSNFYSSFLPDIYNLAKQDEVNRIYQRFQSSKNVQLERLQVAKMLAAAFLCMVPNNNLAYSINFRALYSSKCNPNKKNRRNKTEKLKCLLHYLKYVVTRQNQLTGTLDYERNVVLNCPSPTGFADKPLKKLTVVTVKSLFDADAGHPQVDFANKYIGGSVLGEGCLQEEIKFITCPELLLAKLFPGEMRDNEAILVSGVQQYAFTTGYNAVNFKCLGAQDPPKSSGTVIAIDALVFTKESSLNIQFSKKAVDREVTKAYAGFSAVDEDLIATGNWGCGFSNGDPILKMKIQWLAASMAGKNLHYYTFMDTNLAESVKKEEEEIRLKNYTISQLYFDLLQAPNSATLEQQVQPALQEPPTRGFADEQPSTSQAPHDTAAVNDKELRGRRNSPIRSQICSKSVPKLEPLPKSDDNFIPQPQHAQENNFMKCVKDIFHLKK